MFLMPTPWVSYQCSSARRRSPEPRRIQSLAVHLAPPARAIQPLESTELTDPPANRDSLDVIRVAETRGQPRDDRMRAASAEPSRSLMEMLPRMRHEHRLKKRACARRAEHPPRRDCRARRRLRRVCIGPGSVRPAGQRGRRLRRRPHPRPPCGSSAERIPGMGGRPATAGRSRRGSWRGWRLAARRTRARRR